MSRTEQTLLEQLQISDYEITRRMDLLELNQDNLDQLYRLKSIVEDNIDEIVSEFYEKQTAIDEIALLIGDSDTLSRLRSAQRKYVLDLFSGRYDSHYVNNRLRIGMVHKRIGVDPKLYLSAVRTLKEVIIKTLRLKLNQPHDDSHTLIFDSLDKLLYFDTTLVFDTYIGSLVGEIETAKKRTELYAKSLEIKVAERTKQLEELSKIDPLTNIYNQRAMREILARELLLAKRNHTKLAMIYFDVDDFKTINDKHGHIAGDEVLKHIGHCMLTSIRDTDVACRYGGDEFCIVLSDCDLEDAKAVCQKIIDSFAEKYPYYSLSMGIAESNIDEIIDENSLIKKADQNMYRAKKSNGFKICT